MMPTTHNGSPDITGMVRATRASNTHQPSIRQYLISSNNTEKSKNIKTKEKSHTALLHNINYKKTNTNSHGLTQPPITTFTLPRNSTLSCLASPTHTTPPPYLMLHPLKHPANPAHKPIRAHWLCSTEIVPVDLLGSFQPSPESHPGTPTELDPSQVALHIPNPSQCIPTLKQSRINDFFQP
jgi:hypothetical protein